MISRAELDELYRADDEARAEHAEWLARREAQARPFARKSDDTVENEPRPAGAADAAPSDGEPLALDVDQIEDALAKVLVLERRRERAERAADVGKLEREIAALDGKVDALLTLIGKSEKFTDLKSADVVDLPNWRRGHVA
jgi:hypothetical protein